MLSPNLLQPTKSSSSRQMLKEMSVVTEEMKAKAEVYHGDETCREKFMLLLADNGLPVGLLTIHQDIEECGYVKELGFVWLKHKEKSEHRFDNVAVLFDIEVTAYFEQNRIKNLTGVKAKEFLIWISLREIYVKYDSPNGSNITFKTPSGLSKSLPLSVFQLPSQPWFERGEEVEEEENQEGNLRSQCVKKKRR